MIKIRMSLKGKICNIDLDQNSVTSVHIRTLCMSKLCCDFQIPASTTVGVDLETRSVLQSIIKYVRTDGQTRAKHYAPPDLVAGCGRARKK